MLLRLILLKSKKPKKKLQRETLEQFQQERYFRDQIL